ncbi:MAG: DNA translocase FtsK 4TM domain-containing protein [Magnetospirillum sp.]|nr:DNA translocase FtsK 4TM domain-containing protein [Magnetospirillum sp.]
MPPKPRHRGFLPQGTDVALRLAGWRIGGLAMVLMALALALALATADHHDPSLNAAVDATATNALGAFGAVTADLLLQLFGLAVVVMVPVGIAWGGALFVTAGVPHLWRWRIAALPLAVVGFAIALAAVPRPDWPTMPAGIGGALGRVIYDGLGALLPEGFAWMAAVVAALSATAGAVWAVGLTAAQWLGLARSVAALTALFHRPDPRPDPRSDAKPMTVRPVTRPVQVPIPTEDGDDDGIGDEIDFDPEDDDLPPPAPQPPEPRGALVQPKRPSAIPGRRERAARQGSLDLGGPKRGGYEIPPLELLAMPVEHGGPRINQDSLAQNAKMLEAVLADFGVNGTVVKVRPGPVVTLYELEPAPGTKTSRVVGLADDIARSMSALAVRIATIPGRSVIGIELPNARRETVLLRELLAAESFERAQARLTLVLGKDISGAPVMVDLARMPHLLIAGTTGSGKSVAINTMILSLLYRLTPEEARVIMIDPKMLELSVYDGIPHLLAPVVTEPGKAVVALKWAVREMEDRYRAMSQLGVRNIAGYNQRLAEAKARGEVLTRTVQVGFDPDTGQPLYEDQQLALEPLPFIVIIVDEMADLMLVAGKDIEAAVQRLAQMARAAGIHLIMATQRPSVDVITGTIKANFPTRISFQVTSKIDSRTILGEQGAEQLLGQGDMLYMASGGRITRVHGPFVTDQEVEKVVEHLRAQGEPSYVEAVTEDVDDGLGVSAGGDGGGSGDDLYDQAVALVAREGKASTSFIQRHLQIGYNRAARLIERMESEGVVGKPNHVGKREVLVRSTRGED